MSSQRWRGVPICRARSFQDRPLTFRCPIVHDRQRTSIIARRFADLFPMLRDRFLWPGAPRCLIAGNTTQVASSERGFVAPCLPLVNYQIPTATAGTLSSLGITTEIGMEACPLLSLSRLIDGPHEGKLSYRLARLQSLLKTVSRRALNIASGSGKSGPFRQRRRDLGDP
jgi:hypothetical protein